MQADEKLLLGSGADRFGRFSTRWYKLHRDRIHAVPDVLPGQPFTLEDVPKVAAAVFTQDFDTGAVRVAFVTNCSR